MIVLRELAFAKVNLYLHVTGKRADGYHLLDSLVAFADVGDTLEAIPDDRITLALEGPYADTLPRKDNSVLQAVDALRAHADIKEGAALTLHKHLPVAAGIGGGSADAAAVLRLLVRLWKLAIAPQALQEIALAVGADVPACLRSSSLYMSGIGESIVPGPVLEDLHAVLVNPGKPLATKEVFAAYTGTFSAPARRPAEFATAAACREFLLKHHNDLEAPARLLMPEIVPVLEQIAQQKGCQLARMSGSGATCFGLFADAAAAHAAADALRAGHKEWWVQPAVLR